MLKYQKSLEINVGTFLQKIVTDGMFTTTMTLYWTHIKLKYFKNTGNRPYLGKYQISTELKTYKERAH